MTEGIGGLPHGWIEARLSELVELNPKHEADLSDDIAVSFVPMSAVDDIDGVIKEHNSKPLGAIKKGYTHFADGDVIFAKITPCMENGKSAVARGLVNGLACGSTEFFVLRSRGAVKPDYLHKFLRQQRYRRDAEHAMTGAVGQARVPKEFLLNTTIPLPPINEQCRLTAKLEELLNRVDVCQKRLEKVPRLLKQFWQSVLAAACSGKLTGDWRSQNTLTDADWHTNILRDLRKGIEDRKRGSFWGSGITASEVNADWGDIPEGWQWVRVKDLGADPSEVVQIGPMSMKSNEFVASGTRVLNVGCVQWGELNLEKCNYLPSQRARDFKRYSLKANDVLFTRSGTVGRSAIATSEVEGALITFHLLRVRTTPEICLPEYLYYTFQGCPAVLKQINSSAIGATRAGFNTRLLEDLYIPLPPPQEQAEIVRTVQDMFESVKTVEERANLSFKAFDSLSQSILAKAFCGELVPQDPNDEPASALLERIRAERAGIVKPERKARRQSTIKSETAVGRSTLF